MLRTPLSIEPLRLSSILNERSLSSQIELESMGWFFECTEESWVSDKHFFFLSFPLILSMVVHG